MVLCLSGNAKAALITDTIVFEFGSTSIFYGTDPDGRIFNTRDDDGVVAWLTTSRDDYAFEFYDFITYKHIFDMPEGTITSATLTLTLRENDDPDEWARVWYRPYAWGDSDWYIGEVTNGTHDYSATVPPGYFYGDPVWFYVTLRSDRGDFAIDKSVLTVNYDPNPEPVPGPVPEPSTMLLLGSGLIGLAGVSLRRLNK